MRDQVNQLRQDFRLPQTRLDAAGIADAAQVAAQQVDDIWFSARSFSLARRAAWERAGS